MNTESLVPHIGIVTDVRVDTPDVKTFRVEALTAARCLSICPASARCCRYRAWARRCSR